MENKGNSVKDYAGCGFTSLLGLLIFGGFCMFMFWLTMQCTGSKIWFIRKIMLKISFLPSDAALIL